MKLTKCKIENFRSYKNAEFSFDDLSVVIGKNDVGKSTLFDALDIFFNSTKPEEGDANIYSDSKEIIITCFFKIEPKMEICLDTSVTTTLEEEYLLDKSGLLQIKQVWEKSKLKKTYIVANYPKIKDSETPLIVLKIGELKKLIPQDADINKSIKRDIRKFLFESKNLGLEEIEIDISSKDTDIASIYEKLKSGLPKFLLFKSDRTNTEKDSEVTQVTKAITQNAISNIEKDFENIKKEVLEKINVFSNATLQRLQSFDKDIAQDLQVEIETKALDTLFSYAFKSDDGVALNKRGSGIKRLFLLSFFLEDSERKTDNNSNMIYAIEEPETSQHPNYQVMIMESLKKLSRERGRQILITTHTPEIVKMASRENIIFIQKPQPNERKISQGGNIDLKEVIDTLGILPYVSYKGVLFVEGETDINFFKNLNKHFEELKVIFDIDTITLIPTQGSHMKNWITKDYLDGSNVKRMHFIDSDGRKNESEEINSKSEFHKVITTKKREIENYFPFDVLEDFFKNMGHQDVKFTDKFKENWDNQDIAKSIANQTKLEEKDIKTMFGSQDLWSKLNKDNMQGFDEIKQWFVEMKKFFDN